MKTHSPQTRTAFTTMELLVTLAVMLVLLSLLLPVAGRMRERNLLLQCAAQQRQIGAALHLYAADHRGDFPPFIQGGVRLNSTGSQNTLPNHLVPPKGSYLPDKKIFADPGAINRIYTENAQGWYDWSDTGQTNRSGYWHVYMNPLAEGSPERAKDDAYGPNDSVRCPPYKVMMYCYYAAGSPKLGNHVGGEVNILRLDGSVERFSRSQYRPGKGIIDNFGHVR